MKSKLSNLPTYLPTYLHRLLKEARLEYMSVMRRTLVQHTLKSQWLINMIVQHLSHISMEVTLLGLTSTNIHVLPLQVGLYYPKELSGNPYVIAYQFKSHRR